MEDNGILVGRIFFMICSFISLICMFSYKFVAKDIWKFMRKYQFQFLKEEPSEMYIKMFRIWTFIVFIIFIIQAITIGK
jgi:hypothetical protein